jgi:hypothetical protein
VCIPYDHLLDATPPVDQQAEPAADCPRELGERSRQRRCDELSAPGPSPIEPSQRARLRGLQALGVSVQRVQPRLPLRLTLAHAERACRSLSPVRRTGLARRTTRGGG